MTQSNQTKEIRELIQQRILVLDGAMGTMLQQKNLTAKDFGGEKQEGCNENLVITRPEIITDIHHAYLRAGADIIETNTFGGTPLVLAEYGLQDRVELINKTAAALAKKAADKFSTSKKPRFVAGAMGPTTKAISITGGVTFQELIEHFYKQAGVLIESGVDLLILETAQDTRNVKAGIIGIQKASDELGIKLPLIISGTIEPTGTMLGGQTAEAFVISIQHADPLAVGLNCATGPEFMTDHIRSIHELTRSAVCCYPNAGLPDEEGKYLETPESLAKQLERFAKNGWLNIVGGCCGTTPGHIRAIVQMIEGKKPRVSPNGSKGRCFYTGIELVESTDENRPLLIGERTNIIGSRIFKNLIDEEKWDEATDVARRQIKNGAQIIDVCLMSPDREETDDIDRFYSQLIRKIKTPVMIDSTTPEAVEKALTYCQGKSIINSINLEDGEEKFKKVCPLAKKYGAALVVGTIDENKEQAQAFTRERKLAVAERSYKLLTKKYGIPEEDIIFDPLVFPCATGDEKYIGGPVETIEGLRLIKKKFPECRTLLGISNVSFGLSPAAREVINSVFLYHCTQAGLDLAIVNAEKLERFAKIPENERHMAESLLFNYSSRDLPPPAPVKGRYPNGALRPPYKGGKKTSPPLCKPARRRSSSGGRPGGVDRETARDWRRQSPGQRIKINRENIAAITKFYRETKKVETRHVASLPLDKRLANYIIEGSKDGLIVDLDLKLKNTKPLDIINGPLMTGMAEVGRLFNNNKLIVAEVLQSAEVMKEAVAHLEKFMDRAETTTRGKVLLATVKGDVHDIGKNLVEIILKNNGYEVINLGIKVPAEDIIAACKKHKPDIIGLSGLLVKSAQQMTITAGDLKSAGIQIPILVGGAALSDKFTRTKIAPSYTHTVIYAKDAMRGLDLANKLIDPKSRKDLEEQSRRGESCPPAGRAGIRPLVGRSSSFAEASADKQGSPPSAKSTKRSKKIRTNIPIPSAPYPDRKKRDVPQLNEIWNYINPQMLYAKHLGFKGNFEKKLAEKDPKALKLNQAVESIKEEAKKFMKVRVVWQFFEAEPNGNSINLYATGARRAMPLHTFKFNRQQKQDGLCLSDYVLPPKNGKRDHVAIFVVGAGTKIREISKLFKEKGEYLISHTLQALALETAEACAEWLHRRIREDWGFPDPKNMTMKERFTAKYRGKRYSFGYPACPNLDDQKGIWKLLRPEEIGVKLTDGMMMDPEASVSALVFHHPDCSYFGVSG